ncbi:MAG: DUF2029 domain-containing protein [Nitrospirae bacterium]|nr:MAG: DUF2029 domain-containing protein [Nitrospirota bacterium]
MSSVVASLVHRISFNQVGAAFIVLAGLLGIQQILMHHINNYLMFSRPFFNLIEGKDLYLDYPNYYLDIYKYSPAFALLFAPLSLMPDEAGIVVWNMINAAVLITALKYFIKDDRLTVYALLIVLLEAVTSLQNLQSNCLLAGLIILTYTNLRKRNIVWAAVSVSLAAYIKIYGIAAAAFAIFFKERFRFGFVGLLSLLLLFLAPLLVLDLDVLILNYKSWMKVVGSSATRSQISVMGILQTWFGWTGSFRAVQAAGALIVVAPLAQAGKWKEHHFQQLYVASILMFVVLFNQMAESPTYVIALSGVAIWFLSFERPSALDIGLLVLVLLVTSLSSTDLFPKYLREHFVKPYTLKAVPVLLVWIKVQWQLWHAGDTVAYRAFSRSDPDDLTLS